MFFMPRRRICHIFRTPFPKSPGVHFSGNHQYGKIGGHGLRPFCAHRRCRQLEHVAVGGRGKAEGAPGILIVSFHDFGVPRQPVIGRSRVFDPSVQAAESYFQSNWLTPFGPYFFTSRWTMTADICSRFCTSAAEKIDLPARRHDRCNSSALSLNPRFGQTKKPAARDGLPLPSVSVCSSRRYPSRLAK